MRTLLFSIFVFFIIQFRQKYRKKGIYISQKYDLLLLIIYIYIIIFLTISYRTHDDKSTVILHPLKTYKQVFALLQEEVSNNQFRRNTIWIKDVVEGFVLNILLFVPFGYLVCCYFYQYNTIYIIIVGYFVSQIIELTQLIGKVGWFDITDIIHNTIGTFIGCYLYNIYPSKDKRAFK